MEDHFDRRGQTVTEGEIKCGELQFLKCDEDAGEIETATRKQDLRLFRLTTETLKCFQQHGQVLHVHAHRHTCTHTKLKAVHIPHVNL